MNISWFRKFSLHFWHFRIFVSFSIQLIGKLGNYRIFKLNCFSESKPTGNSGVYLFTVFVTWFNFVITFIISPTAQKMKLSINDFFSKCYQIRRKLRIWSRLLKKSIMENFIFLCSVLDFHSTDAGSTVSCNCWTTIHWLLSHLEKVPRWFFDPII